MNPHISIIVPYYNGQRFISETLDSLFAQDYENMEVIVVNDNSSQESLKALAPYQDRITIIHRSENGGVAAARNTGITAAQGDIIGMIDQDDLWPIGRLQITLDALDGYDYVRGQTVAFELHNDGTRSSSESKLLPALVGAALYRRYVFDIVGLLDESMHEGDDFDWNARLNESACKGTVVKEITLFYRKHGQNFSIMSDDYVRKGVFAVIKRKLKRTKSNKQP